MQPEEEQAFKTRARWLTIRRWVHAHAILAATTTAFSPLSGGWLRQPRCTDRQRGARSGQLCIRGKTLAPLSRLLSATTLSSIVRRAAPCDFPSNGKTMYPSIDFQTALRFFASWDSRRNKRLVTRWDSFPEVDTMKWMIVEIEDGLQRSLRGVLLWVKEAEVMVLLVGGIVDSDASLCFNDSFLDDRVWRFLDWFFMEMIAANVSVEIWVRIQELIGKLLPEVGDKLSVSGWKVSSYAEFRNR